MFLDLDVASDESASTVVQQVIERFGRIDVLINNAGIGTAGAAEESSVAQEQRLFNINVFGVIRMTKAVLPQMRAQGSGRIINISSVYGFIPQPYMAAYVASKHAVEGYSESLDHEVREHGVRVLLVEPANTNTGFDANMVRADTPLRSPRSSSRQRPTRSRNCATPPAPGPDASAHCAASSPPGPSTNRSANSTS
jgi:short-subunit dehydrogenase